MKTTALFLLTLALCLSLVGCATEASATVPGEVVDYTTGSPWLDPEIQGNVQEDTQTDPRDNFALAVNKDLALTYKIPTGYRNGGTIPQVSIDFKGILENLLETVDSTSSHDAELCLNYYHLLLDWETRNALGMEPVLGDIRRIQELRSLEELSSYLTETAQEDLFWCLVFQFVDTDLDDATSNRLYLMEPELLWEDSDYYRKESESAERTRSAYSKMMGRMLVKAGYSQEEAEDTLEKVLTLEKQLATVTYSTEESNSPDYSERINNPMSLKEAQDLCGAYPLIAQMRRAGLEVEECTVQNPAYLRLLATLYTEENLEAFKAFLIVNGLKYNQTNLDRECYDLKEEFKHAVYGTEGSVSDEAYAVTTITEKLGWPLSRLYCDTFFGGDEKEEIQAIIDDSLKAYRVLLEKADFLSDETREKAIYKLDNMTVRCLYPDDWTPYAMENVEIAGPEDGGTVRDAEKAIERYYVEKQVDKINEKVDKERWIDGIWPIVVNSFYNPMDNSINILAGFTRGSIYNAEMSREEVLGSIGCVIGHEIAHAFDSHGAQFDAEGNLSSWWTEEDYAVFGERNRKIAEYFSSLSPWEGQMIMGETLTGEAGADMSGMAAMLQIASTMSAFDYDAFFRAFARLWFNVESPTFSIVRITQDVHPLCYLRINVTLQQFDEFLECYGVKEGDGMYLAPEDRIKIW